jgi:hypothetical protein
MSHVTQYIITISSQVIQVLHQSQPQVQIEVPLTTTNIVIKLAANETDLVKDLVKHEPRHSMPPIDSAQRRRDCMCDTR